MSELSREMLESLQEFANCAACMGYSDVDCICGSRKSFISVPACPDINFNPKTCYECGELSECHRCKECSDKFLKELRYEVEKDVKKMHDYVHGKSEARQGRPDGLQVAKKPSDANYYRIIIAASVLITIGYAYLIWCLL